MPRTKSYLAMRPASDLALPWNPDSGVERVIAINFAEESHGRRNPTSARSLNLSRWLGTPHETWAYAWVHTTRYLLRRADLSVASCVKAGQMHATFISFLAAHRITDPPQSPEQLQPRHIRQYVEWLKGSSSRNAASSSLKSTKTLVMGMLELGLVKGSPVELFPRNLLPPDEDKRPNAATPLSELELGAVVAALKKDLISLHKDCFEGSNLQAIIVYLLVIAIRTGGNVTPLLELTRDALKPHLLPGMMRLDFVKYRGANTYSQTIRGETNTTTIGTIAVPMDGVAILKKVLESTALLSDLADEDSKNLVWLYRSVRGDSPVLSLNQSRLIRGVDSLVKRHGLNGDDGEPLRLNLSRLRKNKAQQLWRMSKGDLVTVALLLGNTPKVADQSYLTITPEIRAEGAEFVGKVFESLLGGGGKKIQATPISACTDSLYGEHAPKDGQSHCDQFMHCMGCSNFAIVGTLADLHRLFSYQVYLRAEVEYFPEQPDYDEWRAHRRRVVEQIDDFTARHFKATLVSEAKQLAQSQPHKFWAVQLRTLQRLGASGA
jgi:hypothetical protein